MHRLPSPCHLLLMKVCHKTPPSLHQGVSVVIMVVELINELKLELGQAGAMVLPLKQEDLHVQNFW